MATTLERVNIDEYKSLRDETLKRIEARNQILSWTLLFAASMFTLALGANGYLSALLVYPVVGFFFSAGFAFNSLMLIEIGSYMRSIEAAQAPADLGWATHLKERYPKIEVFELISSAGLFVGTQGVSLLLYFTSDLSRQSAGCVPLVVAWAAVAGTVLMAFYPWIYHRLVLRRPEAQARATPREIV